MALREPVEDPSGPRPRRTVSSRDNVRFLREAWERRAVGTRADARLAEDALTVLGLLQEDRSAEPAHPLLVRQREDRPLRWAIKIGASEVVTREHWGDWHFAMALRDSLERLGHHVTIDCRDRWYRPTSHLDDVVLVLRGLSYYEVSPQQINVSWVISHPELVSARELDAYDLAFGASTRWCERTSRRSSTPVELLLQCTDHRRFHPVEPDPERRHELLAVANARGGTPPRPRAAVEAALRAGLVPAVYGLRWKGLLPAGAWRGPYIPNDDLPAVYGAAGAVLNDHWDDMRENGLLSNRLFDLAACDARVISDHLPEIADVFGDVVATFRRPEEIPALLRRHLEESPERREARQALGEHVRREHTFDARARVLSERVLEAHARALPRQRAGLAARR